MISSFVDSVDGSVGGSVGSVMGSVGTVELNGVTIANQLIFVFNLCIGN